jgi:hypothetical protein
MSLRRLLAPGAVAIVAATGLVTGLPANAAPSGAICQASGAATISPGLTTTAKTQKVTLTGVKLSNCLTGSAGSPGVPKPTGGTVTVSPNPITSKASCASGNLKFIATIKWKDGTTTTATISTTGLLATQTLQGKVTSSTNPALAPGNILAGEVGFAPKNPAQNCTTTPVKAVTFQGVLGTGTPS